MRRPRNHRSVPSVMVLGVGSFAHSTGTILKDDGASVSTFLTRHYGHYPPSLVGPTYTREQFASPVPLLRKNDVDLVVPMSIDWAQAPWSDNLLAAPVRIFGPTGEAMRIERERDFARKLCAEFKIPFPRSFVAPNRLEAEKTLARHPAAYVIKNPLCSPTSPIHTIVCETPSDTRSWLKHLDYAEGVFLQEYLGRAEAGHIALVSGGEVHSLVTNQEYKRAFNGNLGIIAGAPLGGLVEWDLEDKYHLARELIHPLLPWLRQVKFHGPLQVTAARHKGRWHVIEYNIRIGVTSGAMLLRMLADPVETLLRTAGNEKLDLRFNNPQSGAKRGRNAAAYGKFGCSITLAGYGYPYVQLEGPRVPVEVTEQFDCDVWWNEVGLDAEGDLVTTGHRIADVIGFGNSLNQALERATGNVRKIRSLGSYYRTDIGQSLWPPGRT